MLQLGGHTNCRQSLPPRNTLKQYRFLVQTNDLYVYRKAIPVSASPRFAGRMAVGRQQFSFQLYQMQTLCDSNFVAESSCQFGCSFVSCLVAWAKCPRTPTWLMFWKAALVAMSTFSYSILVIGDVKKVETCSTFCDTIISSWRFLDCFLFPHLDEK